MLFFQDIIVIIILALLYFGCAFGRAPKALATEERLRFSRIVSTFLFLILESRALSSTAHSGMSDLW